MNKFPAPDMAGALRLTRQGKLREAVAALRGKAPVPPAPPATVSPLQLAGDVAQLLKGSFSPGGKPPMPAGSRFEARSFSNDAGSRNYKLFIPSRYGGRHMPLVVMLHGCTQSPDDFAAGTRMNELAEVQGFLVAYPEQARSANMSKCWNWFNAVNQQREQGEASLIAGITRQVIQDFAVDPARVYIAGLSAGGATAAIMGSVYPELYAAIGVHSGLARGSASDLPSAMAAMKHGAAAPSASARLVPAIVFHGDRDTTVNVANGGQVIAQSKGTADLRREIEEAEAGGMRYTRIVQMAGGKIVLEEWVLHGAGHAWSGGSKAGSFTDPHGPDASAEMLRFFMSLVG